MTIIYVLKTSKKNMIFSSIFSINSSKISNKNNKINSINTNSNSDIKKFRYKNISAPWWDKQWISLLKRENFI